MRFIRFGALTHVRSVFASCVKNSACKLHQEIRFMLSRWQLWYLCIDNMGSYANAGAALGPRGGSVSRKGFHMLESTWSSSSCVAPKLCNGVTSREWVMDHLSAWIIHHRAVILKRFPASGHTWGTIDRPGNAVTRYCFGNSLWIVFSLAWLFVEVVKEGKVNAMLMPSIH